MARESNLDEQFLLEITNFLSAELFSLVSTIVRLRSVISEERNIYWEFGNAGLSEHAVMSGVRE